MHDDMTRPKGSMVAAVTLKSKVAAGSVSSGGNSKSRGSMIYLKALTKSLKPLLDGPAKTEHMSALYILPFKIPASGSYDARLNSCLTTTITMHVRAAKSFFYVIMHEIYSFRMSECRAKCNIKSEQQLKDVPRGVQKDV